MKAKKATNDQRITTLPLPANDLEAYQRLSIEDKACLFALMFDGRLRMHSELIDAERGIWKHTFDFQADEDKR